MKKPLFNLLAAIGLIVLAAYLRFIPHPANFAPMTAVALFGGAVLPRRTAVIIPLVAMVVSDLLIGLHPLFPVTWSCYMLIAWASSRWLRNGKPVRGVLLVFSSSLFFFVVSNLAVWLWGGMYDRSVGGLARCFTLALPFFTNTFYSDVFYSAVLFGCYALILKGGWYLAGQNGLKQTGRESLS